MRRSLYCRAQYRWPVAIALVVFLAGFTSAWAASLADGKVTPATGDVKTRFVFSVMYSDPNGVRPNAGYVWIDGDIRLTMCRSWDVRPDFRTGVVYKAGVYLRPGTHKFRFVFYVPIEGTSCVSRPVQKIHYPNTDSVTCIEGPVVKAPTYFVTGRVRVGRAPVEGVVIKVERRGGATVEATTNAEGRYKVSGLEAGRYAVKAFDPEGDLVFKPSAHVFWLATSRRYVDFCGESRLSISGVVKDAAGNPLSGVSVTATAGGTVPSVQAVRQATTDAEGRYKFTGIAAGSYTVAAQKDGLTFDPPKRDLTVPPSRGGADFVGIAPSGPSTIAGTVRDDGGVPLEWVSVTAQLSGTDTVLQATTDVTGQYAFTDVAPGTYYVRAEMAPLTFAPEVQQITVPPSQESVDFTGSVPVTGGYLSNGAVTPAVGPIGATFRFSVTYTNTGGNWPMNTTVVVDESHWHIMDMADPTDTDPTDGMEFIYDVPGLTLAMGQHTFRFQSGYEDMFGIWDLWLPEGGGTYDGPTVTSD